jgi:hypothetical protein
VSTSLDQKFTADASQIEAVFEKMKRHNQDLLTQLQKIKQETKQGHDQANKGEQERGSWLKGNISDLGKMALGYFSIQSAIGYVSQAFDHMIERQKKSAEQQKEINDLILDAAGTSGNMLEADRYKRFAGIASRTGLSDEKTATVVLSEISRATQFSSMETREKLATSVLGAAPLMSSDHLGKTAMMAGELNDIFGAKYKGRESDIADLAIAAKQLGGADWDKIASPFALKSLTSVVASGAMGPEEGLGMMISGFASNQNSRLMESLDDALNKHIPKIEQPKTWEDRLNNKLAKMSPVQRLAQIDADREKGDKGAGKFLLGGNAVNYYAAKGDLAPIMAELNAAAAPGDYIAAQLNKVAGSPVFQQRAAEVRADALKSKVLSENEIRSQAIERATKFANDQIEKQNPLGPNWLYTYSEGSNTVRSAFTAEENIPERLVPKTAGIPADERAAFIAEQRELITQQLQAAKAMKDAAEAMKPNWLRDMMREMMGQGAAPANPIDVRARGESR